MEIATKSREKFATADKLTILPLMVAQSTALMRLGKYDEGLNICQEGEKLIDSVQQTDEGLENVEKWKAHLLHVIGCIYRYKGESETALDYSQRSLKIREKIGNEQDIARSLNNIGKVYHLKGELESANYFYSRSLKIKDKIGNNLTTAETIFNLIQLSLDQKKQEKTQENLM